MEIKWIKTHYHTGGVPVNDREVTLVVIDDEAHARAQLARVVDRGSHYEWFGLGTAGVKTGEAASIGDAKAAACAAVVNKLSRIVDALRSAQ